MSQRLVLTTTSLHNVVISNESDAIYYEVITPKWERHLTKVNRLDPNTREFGLVGELQNEDGKAVAVRMYGGELRPTAEFLKSGGNDGVAGLCSHGKFKGKDGKQYIWRQRSRHLELIREDLPETQPVAVYKRQKRYLFLLRMSRHPFLEIDPRAIDTLDTLIISFLLIERKRRDGAD